MLGSNPGAQADAPGRQKSEHEVKNAKNFKDGVGDLEEKGEFGIGKAPKNDKP